MKDYLAAMKALSDPSRVRALCALKDGELCACQIIELLGLAPSTVSKHLSILQNAGLLESRKEGRWVHFRLPPKGSPRLLSALIHATFESMADSSVIKEDGRRLKEIRRGGAEALCRRRK